MYYVGILIKWQLKGSMFLMNVLPDVYIYPLKEKNAPLPQEMHTSGSTASSQRLPTVTK